MIRTAVVAYGFSASTFHVPFITADPRFQLTAIVTSKVESVKLDFTNVNIVPNIEDLDPDQIDLVVITTPNHLHFEQARFFIEKGCQVIIEKPFVLSSQQAQQLSDLADQHQVKLVVFQNRRWDGDYLTVCSLIEGGSVGDVKRMTSRFDRFRPNVRERWREQPGPGAGILWDLGPHLLDQAVALFGQPKSIQANVVALRDGAEVDDNFDIWLDYGSHAVTLSSSAFQAGPNARFSLEGTKGTFLKYGLDVQEDALKSGADVLDDRWGQESEDAWGILYEAEKSRLITTKPGNYGVFWHQMADCLLNGARSPVPIEESVLVIKLIELAHQSSQSGQKIML